MVMGSETNQTCEALPTSGLEIAAHCLHSVRYAVVGLDGQAT